MKDAFNPWPPLAFAEWQETAMTLHMWTQIVGKIRLTLSPWINHSWHVTLYVTSRGLTTSPIPHGTSTFEIRFDFIDHELRILKSDGAARVLKLRPQPVAKFYREVMNALDEMELRVTINTTPNEIQDAIPFDQDEQHRSYNREYANRFWRVLVQSDRVFKQFRSRFCGKCSPVHFFWGSFDLAVTRFSGRHAPEHPGGAPGLGDWVMREAYSRECSSCGFWPGSGAVQEPAFYAYMYPEPAGYREHPARPDAAYYSDAMREYILPYEAVRRSSDPDRMLAEFFRSTYEAGADLAGWNRTELERDVPAPARATAEPAPPFPQDTR